jgi:hypothetical protein
MSDAVEKLKKKALEKAYKKDSKGHPKIEEEAALLRGMAEMFEEFKPFPKDKVERSIEKKKEKAGDNPDTMSKRTAAYNAHKQKAVLNFKTKMADPPKAGQKFTGSDRAKTQDQIDKHHEKRDEKYDKANKYYDKKVDKKGTMSQKQGEKYVKKLQKGDTSAQRRDGMQIVRKTWNKATHTDDRKQAEANKKDKADRASAKSSLDRAGLESALNAKPKREKMKGPKMKGVIRKESAFTDFCDAATQPLYEKEGEVPKCPPGYKYDVEMKMCVPKTNKDSIGKDQKYGNKDMKPGNGAGYNVWGNSGYSGAGFAWEEGPTDNDRAGGQE